MTAAEDQIVLAAYGWVSLSPLLTWLDVVVAEAGIVLLPMALGLLWLWPGGDVSHRREAVVGAADQVAPGGSGVAKRAASGPVDSKLTSRGGTKARRLSRER